MRRMPAVEDGHNLNISWIDSSDMVLLICSLFVFDQSTSSFFKPSISACSPLTYPYLLRGNDLFAVHPNEISLSTARARARPFVTDLRYSSFDIPVFLSNSGSLISRGVNHFLNISISDVLIVKQE